MRVGTVVYHGTRSLTDFADLAGPAWVTRERAVAVVFSGGRRPRVEGEGRPRVLVFRVAARNTLRVFRSQQSIDLFMARSGHEPGDYTVEDMIDATCAAGFDGWTIPNNYDPGDDTMLCEPADVLEFVREEDP